MSCVDEYYREAHSVVRHANTVATFHKRYSNLVHDVKRDIQTLANLAGRTRELVMTVTNQCEKLINDTHRTKESYLAHKQALEHIAQQHKQSRTLLSAITDILHQIQQNADFFLSSSQTLARLAKNAEVRAHHARKEGKGLAIIAQECLALARQAHAPFAEFHQHVQKLGEIAEPISRELVNMAARAAQSETLLSHAFNTLSNFDHAVTLLEEITTQLQTHTAVGDQLQEAAAEESTLLDACSSSSMRGIEDMLICSKGLEELLQRLRRVARATSSTARSPSQPPLEKPYDDLPAVLREYLNLLEQLLGHTNLSLCDDDTLLRKSALLCRRTEELSTSANTLIKHSDKLEHQVTDVLELRASIERSLTETHTTSSHILECTSQLDSEIAMVEKMTEKTRSLFSKIKVLSAYAKIEQGRSRRYRDILAPVVCAYADLEKQTGESYARLLPQIMNLKLHTQHLRAEQKIPNLEIIRQPHYEELRTVLDDILRISSEKARLTGDITRKMEQLRSVRTKLTRAWQDYRKTLPRTDKIKKHLHTLTQESDKAKPSAVY